MIFLGDLACPNERVSELNDAISQISLFKDEVVVLNFEAVVSHKGNNKVSKLYNNPSVLDSLIHQARKVIVSMANNHMYDYPEEIMNTKNFLESKGVGVFGLKESNGSILPFEYEDETGKYSFFGHCWDLYTRTNPNKINEVQIVDNPYSDFKGVVEGYIKQHPDRKVICFMHWNYDLETLPFPMHRIFAHDLIDVGCEAIIGSHSHVPQCVEVYKEKPIAYCLGNFYLPSGIFFNGSLSYPKPSHKTIGVSLSKEVKILTFSTDEEQPIRLVETNSLNEYDDVLRMTPQDYIVHFIKNRAKRLLVPVFKDYKGAKYLLKNNLAIARVLLIKILK